MNNSNLLVVMLCSLIFLVGCESPSKDDDADKTTTDYAKEAARRIQEKGGCKYPPANISTSSAHSFSFKYPQDWAVLPENQKSDTVVMVTRSVPINGFLPCFYVSTGNEDPSLFKYNGAHFKRDYRKYFLDVKILELEHGKLNDVDAVFVHYQGGV